MAGIASFSIPQTVPISTSLFEKTPFVPLLLRHRDTIDLKRRGWTVVFASEGRNGLENGESNQDGRGDLKRDGPLRWRDLLAPDPENFLSIGLTGILTWASVQVLWQIFFISLAILVAALKYSFIAALLLFILITLL